MRIFVGRFAAGMLTVFITVAGSGCGNDEVSSRLGSSGATQNSINSKARPAAIYSHTTGTLPHDRSGSPGTISTFSCASLGGGYTAYGGGYVGASGSTIPAILYADGPGLGSFGTPVSWVIKGWSDSDSKDGTYDVYVTCARP